MQVPCGFNHRVHLFKKCINSDSDQLSLRRLRSKEHSKTMKQQPLVSESKKKFDLGANVEDQAVIAWCLYHFPRKREQATMLLLKLLPDPPDRAAAWTEWSAESTRRGQLQQEHRQSSSPRARVADEPTCACTPFWDHDDAPGSSRQHNDLLLPNHTVVSGGGGGDVVVVV